MTNLRKLLSTINNPKQSLILGRIITRRNILSYLFPWNVYTTILPHAGIVFSRSALKYLANDKCFGWLSPRATERALIQCINLMNIQLIDPIDKNESLHCCSDEAVSFDDNDDTDNIDGNDDDDDDGDNNKNNDSGGDHNDNNNHDDNDDHVAIAMI
ncbi:hypothetical protein DINM_001711 [Dirofilaria immitis]|nr:hypothetical protein [Dirofilaria immitis]